MDRFSAFEDPVERSAKIREREVIAQVHGAQQLAQRMAGSIDPITTRSTAESFQYIGRRAPPLIDRGGKAQQVIPPFSDRLEGHIMLDNTNDGGGHFEPPWQMQMPVAQTVESRRVRPLLKQIITLDLQSI